MDDNSEFTNQEKLKFLQTEITQESHLYWMRFAGFAALHAALIAASSTAALKVGLFGIFLAVVWLITTILSIEYQRRYHTEYHDLLKVFKLKNNSEVNKFRLLISSTSFWGFVASLTILSYWIYCCWDEAVLFICKGIAT